MSKLLLFLLPPTLLFLIFATLYFLLIRTRRSSNKRLDTEGGEEQELNHLRTFVGGEGLTAEDILEAEGEVIGKSGYGTIYKAAVLKRRSGKGVNLGLDSLLLLLRFVKPKCCNAEYEDVIGLLGSIRALNLVPILGVYVGFRSEKLLVHPFYPFGSLAQFIKDGKGDCHEWMAIHKISIGIARGLDHLHSGLNKPVIHGNLKSKNILLDNNLNPYISDFGLHLLLNTAAGQDMLDAAAVQGYKAPEIIKMRDCDTKTDIYSMGVILLEILTGREPVNLKSTSPCEDYYLTNMMRNAILDHRISDLFHPEILLSRCSDGSLITEERILKFFQLAMACCSPSPALRPSAKQVIAKLEEIGR